MARKVNELLKRERERGAKVGSFKQLFFPVS
jgi:hypothetical protein